MSITPVWVSEAESARFTFCDWVLASPLLIVTEPVGADVSRYTV